MVGVVVLLMKGSRVEVRQGRKAWELAKGGWSCADHRKFLAHSVALPWKHPFAKDAANVTHFST